jgi:subtilisin family serine protease
MKVFVFTLILVKLFAFQTYSQVQRGVQGEIIPGYMMVQLSDLENLNTLSQTYSPIEFRVERILSQRLKIALVKYDETKAEADELLSQVRSIPYVINAQHDTYVQLREATQDTMPNDPMFGQQWNFHNTGQSGGVPGADVDALRAWGITTGGLTAHGDTIVVAVIDGGCHLGHPDLSLFKNWHEIPGNGIDDDGNGYIDDFHGWNAYNNSGNIPGNNHGTHVSGTVGAHGNNSLGVTGVNWNVKVMPIAGSSGSQSVVVNAYSYVYDMRALYDETDGEYGAFVVATNSSFGIDGGQPQNYPIWGAMYDSMGALGILSAAATANRNWNIDVTGDVPTAFPSPHLISVTNTTRMDLRNTGAGYGLQTIDLGAPGTAILSTTGTSGYGNSTGTSMASPHVAGAVALLISAADSAFISYYKENPGEAALQLKQYILDGTDKIAALENITVSGGRLNLYKPILMLLNLYPRLALDPDTVSVSLYPDEEISAQFFVHNTGGDTLNFVLSIANQPEWISFEADSGRVGGGDSLAVTLYFNSYGLDPDEYSTIMLVQADEGQQEAVVINMEVMKEVVGLREISQKGLKVNVRPNPFSTATTFVIEHANQTTLRILITDMQGRIVQQHSPASYSGKLEWQWHGDDLHGNSCSNGVYFYHIESEAEVQSGKLILQR